MSSSEENRKFRVELEGRDLIEVNFEKGKSPQVHFRGCTELMDLMKSMRKNFGIDLKQWPMPTGTSHSEILLRELVLKLRGDWHYPNQEEEVCHCRNVSRQTIDQAIISGAHTTAVVSRQTSASTACGTCRTEVQKMIDYRLQGGTIPATQKKSA